MASKWEIHVDKDKISRSWLFYLSLSEKKHWENTAYLEKIYSKCMSSRGLYLNCLKNLYEDITTVITNKNIRKKSLQMWAKNLDRHFSIWDTQTANKNIKLSLINRKLQSNLYLVITFYPWKTNVSKDVWKLRPFSTLKKYNIVWLKNNIV